MDDTPEAESLPRGGVVEYLASIKKDLAISYLEHLITDLQEMSPTFHDRLVSLYFEKASDLQLIDKQRGEVREKLVKFLEESDQYMPERVLARLQNGTSFVPMG